MPTWLWVVGGLITFVVLLGMFGSHAAIAAGRAYGTAFPMKPAPYYPETPEVRAARLKYREAKRKRRALKEQQRQAKQAFND